MTFHIDQNLFNQKLDTEFSQFKQRNYAHSNNMQYDFINRPTSISVITVLKVGLLIK